MFKLAKWAFDMGVRQERVRISAELQLELAHLGNYPDAMWPGLGNTHPQHETEEQRKARLNFDTAVSRNVMRIIGNIMEPQPMSGPSKLFPNDNHKG